MHNRGTSDFHWPTHSPSAALSRSSCLMNLLESANDMVVRPLDHNYAPGFFFARIAACTTYLLTYFACAVHVVLDAHVDAPIDLRRCK